MNMFMKKIHFEVDDTIKASSIKKAILKKYKNYSINKANIIVVIGGDGFMLKTLKKYQKYNKEFYGMNRGTHGFLMNKYKLNNIYKNLFTLQKQLQFHL